jgi:hypothetical protein
VRGEYSTEFGKKVKRKVAKGVKVTNALAQLARQRLLELHDQPLYGQWAFVAVHNEA